MDWVVSKFNALNHLGWVSGACYMSQCGCMLPFGRCLAAFNTKYVLIAAIVFFMIGFAISGGAQGWLQESFRSGPPLDLDRLDRLFRRDMQPCVLHSRIAVRRPDASLEVRCHHRSIRRLWWSYGPVPRHPAFHNLPSYASASLDE